MTPLPDLQTPRLVLRQWRVSDANDAFEYCSDQQVTRLAMWPRHDVLQETIEEFTKAEQRYLEGWTYWGIEHKADMKFIGAIGFPQWNRTDRRAELSYALSRKYWNQGLMTEAIAAALDYGWHEMKLNRIEARCIQDNVVSIALQKKFGFVLEGIQRKAAFVEGRYLDIGMYALLNGDTDPR